MAYFQDSWHIMLVGYELRRCDTAANSWRPAPRLDIHSDCLHAGITIEYFTRFVRLPNEPDRAGAAQARKTPPAVAQQCRRMPPRTARLGVAGSLTCAHARHWTRRRRGLHQPRLRDHARPPSR